MRIQFSRMGRWATANDTAGDRILTFASSFEDPGPHACTIKAMDVTQPSCIASVTNGVQLMHGGIYNILLSMQDFVGNPVSTATNYMIEHDVETETPVFSEPSKNRIKVAFVIQFTLPENATAGTVKVKIDSLDVTLDPTGTRTIVFSNPIQYENSYTFTMTNLSIAATNVTNIESVSPAVDLVHGVQYVMKVEYRDYLANSRAEMFSAESVMTFDTFTEPIFILSPTTGNTFREAFPLQFQLSERATENTVKITFTRTGGEVDNDSPHEVIFSVTTGQTYDVTMGALSGLASANALVISSSSNDLKHHAIYDISMIYQDYAGNVPVLFTASNMKFDTFTETPTLNAPATSAFIPETFVLTITLPEKALAGTVKVTITYVSSVTGTTEDARVMTFNSTMVVDPGTYTMNVPTLSTATSVVPEIQSISPATDLVDGTKYSFLLEYQDIAGNDKATTISNDVGFSGTATIVATLNSPVNDASIPQIWSVDVILFETMSSCNITIITTPTAPVMKDVVTYRLVQLSQQALLPGSHIYTIYHLSELVSRSGDVDSVSPADDLFIGSLYTIRLTCSDAVGNNPASVEATNVEFAGNNTLLPLFTEPIPFQSIREDFTLNFTLPESAHPGSVKLVIVPKVTNVGVPDNHGVRILTFSALFESAGIHTGTIQKLSTTTDLGHVSQAIDVDTGATATDLIDGAIYTLSIEYQDRQQNAKAAVNHTDVTFAGRDTLAPLFFLPKANTNIPIVFYFDVEVLEKALPGTVQMEITRTGGNTDSASRIITFSSIFELAGRHSILLTNLADMNLTAYPQITSISGANLNHGTP